MKFTIITFVDDKKYIIVLCSSLFCFIIILLKSVEIMVAYN